MDMYGQKSKSIPQKLLINILELLFLGLAYWLLFQAGGDFIETNFGLSNAKTALARRLLIYIFHVIIFLRLGFMMLYLLKRRIPWEESLSVPLAFAVYYIGFSLFVLPTAKPLDSLDYGAIVLFLVGCSLNTVGEVQRHIWKQDPGNKGKLYTRGLFKYSMHINYFGDLLWVFAYALVCRNLYAFLIPVLLFCFFAFYNIPKLDAYLKEKYGQDFVDYANSTKKFIPFIY